MWLLHCVVNALYLFIYSSDNLDSTSLSRNIKVVAEALARHIFNLSAVGDVEIFDEGLVGGCLKKNPINLAIYVKEKCY